MKRMAKGNMIFFGILLCTISCYSQETNIALHKPVIVSSEASGFPASNIVDGKISRTSKWQAANGKAPHIIEIDLRKYYTITGLVVHSGILDAEKKPDEMTQAAGFWSVKNFKLQYWDDANWSDFPNSEIHENRQASVRFNFNPAITTFKLRLVCDDGEPINIMEIEAFGSVAPNMPEPPTVSSSIKKEQQSTGPKQATITVSNKVVGKTMKYVGYNQGYYLPGTNVSAWVEYSNVNSLRVWASLNAFVPQSAVEVDKNLSSVQEFDKRKAALRINPENNKYIDWKKLLPLYDLPDSSSTNAMVFNYALTELQRLGIDVVLQIGSTDFQDNWENKWKQWQRYYALAYYSARKGGVSMFAMQNEPNHRNSGPMKLDQWIMGMQIVSDAIHAAVEDVNKKYNKKLQARFVGPVTAGQNTDWWAAISKAVRTDYHGKKINRDLLQIFSTHSYNSPAAGYESRISNIRKIIQDNHPAGMALPIVYTEIGRWMNAYLIDKEETMDSPSLFTEWAGIYSNNMKNGGYGMWAFKFANTSSGPYPLGIKSGHHYVWHGRRIVEDAYNNVALRKPVTASASNTNASLVTDGIKTDASTWISDSSSSEKWLEINLDSNQELGSAVIYTGDASGVYTSPERIRNFRLQYFSANEWKDIPGAVLKDNKYAQVFCMFTKPVTTDRVRFISDDKGNLKVREIKLFTKADGPSGKPDYNVSGIQRTGEVVRLFAKGFKEERPLLQTVSSVDDADLDSYTSYDKTSGNYYIWLVQRGLNDYQLKLDLKGLGLPAGNPVTAEGVSPSFYGEVFKLNSISSSGQIDFNLPAQSVVLLTIPKAKLLPKKIKVLADAMVEGGKNTDNNYGKQPQLSVQLNASEPDKNQVSYLYFDLSRITIKDVQRVMLKVNGYTDKKDHPFVLHVYAVPSIKWDQQKLTWKNAPLLDSKEALVKEVSRKAFVAGELAFTGKTTDHMLDITSVLKKHPGMGITFILIRETRELGDDIDKEKKVILNSSESGSGAEILYWTKDGAVK